MNLVDLELLLRTNLTTHHTIVPHIYGLIIQTREKTYVDILICETMRRFIEKITRRRVQDKKAQLDDSRHLRNAADTGLKIIYEGTRCHVE